MRVLWRIPVCSLAGSVSSIRSFGIVAALALVPSAPASAVMTPFDKNGQAAIYSYDHAVAFLGLVYGVDPASPSFSVLGNVSAAGFDSVLSSSYFGTAFSATISGSYDITTDSTIWSGSGTYGSENLSYTGYFKWTSANAAELENSVEIAGGPKIYTADAAGIPQVDGLQCSDLTPQKRLCVIYSNNWVERRLGGGPKNNYYTTITTTPGSITENTLYYRDKGGKIDVRLGYLGGGVLVENDGYDFIKTTTITKVPEPSTWAMFITGFGLLGHAARRQRRAQPAR